MHITVKTIVPSLLTLVLVVGCQTMTEERESAEQISIRNNVSNPKPTASYYGLDPIMVTFVDDRKHAEFVTIRDTKQQKPVLLPANQSIIHSVFSQFESKLRKQGMNIKNIKYTNEHPSYMEATKNTGKYLNISLVDLSLIVVNDKPASSISAQLDFVIDGWDVFSDKDVGIFKKNYTSEIITMDSPTDLTAFDVNSLLNRATNEVINHILEDETITRFYN